MSSCTPGPLLVAVLCMTQVAVAQKPAASRPEVLIGETARLQTSDSWIAGLSLAGLVAQLVMVTSYGESPPPASPEYKRLTRAVRDLKVGGLIVVNRVVEGSVRNAEPQAMASFLNHLQELAPIPLLVGADFERGASMRVSGTIKYPHLMAYGAADRLELTRALGLVTAREARALGVHWVFAPVADVNSNPANPVINTRSFGQDPQRVAAHVAAFIDGAHAPEAPPVLVTAKHFPGHGDTEIDSHLGLARLAASRERLEQVEFTPFRAAIAAGVDSVMTAHMAVPSIEEREIPATVSGPLLNKVLRQQLGFSGLIVTDAMDMAGLTQLFAPGEAAVRALEAGVDLLLMPPDPAVAIGAVVHAVESGRLSRSRIETSVRRLLEAKLRLGLANRNLVDLSEISRILQDDSARASAQEAADRAVTLIRNERELLPLRDPGKACVLILAESRGRRQGSVLAETLERLQPALKVTRMDPTAPGESASYAKCQTTVVAAFASASAYKGNVALPRAYLPLMRRLAARDRPLILVALGSPYLIQAYPKTAAYLATFSTAATAEAAAAKAIVGAINPGGKLPVELPDIAGLGAGLSYDNMGSQPPSARQ